MQVSVEPGQLQGWWDLNPNDATAYSFGFGTGTQKATIRSTALLANDRNQGDAGIFGTYHGLEPGTSQTFRTTARIRLGNVTNLKPDAFNARLTIHFLGSDGRALVGKCNSRRYDTGHIVLDHCENLHRTCKCLLRPGTGRREYGPQGTHQQHR